LFVELQHDMDSKTSHMTNFSFDFHVEYQSKIFNKTWYEITKPKLVNKQTYGIADNSNLI